MADQFVLVRIVNMRGVDLRVFDFDFDLTWAALFMNADDFVHGRYGARDEGPAEAGLSLSGLKYAMQQALESHRENPNARPKPRLLEANRIRVEMYPAARRLKADACIHCHQVHDFQTDEAFDGMKWSKDMMWRFPPAKNLGITLDVDQGDRVKSVMRGGIAAATGLTAGDVLSALNGVRISSQADVQYALHQAPNSGRIRLSWTRNGLPHTDQIELTAGWRKSDISWRASMWNTPPAPGVYGRNLTDEQKEKLGLAKNRLAFSQGNFVPPNTRKAGIRGGDVIIGVDGKTLDLKMLQFNAYIREHYGVGDTVTFDILRNGKPIKIPMKLPKHPRY